MVCMINHGLFFNFDTSWWINKTTVVFVEINVSSTNKSLGGKWDKKCYPPEDE